MSAGTEPVRRPRTQTGSEGATLLWLDALASGICTPEEFLSAMNEQFQADRDANWEILSLIDQYYRRGKIKSELFRTLKSRLEDSALSGEEHASPSVTAHSSTTVTTPAAAYQNATASPSAAASPKAAAPQRETSAESRVAIGEVAIGDVLRKRYVVRGVLGHGGMGTVFEAIDEYRLELPTSTKRLAIKVLHTAVTQREELLSELQREFQHLQLLSHPNIVRVHEFDRDGDLAFFTMELLSGALLSQVLNARNGVALPRPYALAVMRDVGAALAHAHSRGVVHGDINPQNIFVTNDAELRVLDFGASHKLLRDVRTPDGDLSQRAPVATPGYASCQLLEGRRPDARDDLFAFACIAYVLLSGQHPFPNRTAVEARAQRLRPSRPAGLTGQQWRVLREGLRWERERRPSDVQNWLTRFNLAAAAPHLPPLSALVNMRPVRKSKMVLATAMIIAFALLAGAVYWTVTHFDSLAQDLARWSSPARSALASADAPGAAPEPAPAPAVANQAPPPASLPQSAPSIPPASGARMVPAPRTNPEPPTAPSSMAGSRIAAVGPTPSPSPRAAAATRSSTSDPSARAANAGPIRVEMAADTVDVPAGDRSALVMVRRKGNLHGDANFTWWTESGTAKPGRDFTPVIPRVEHIADGSSNVGLDISVSGTPRTQPKSFYVVIERTESGGAALGARTLTMVTLRPPD